MAFSGMLSLVLTQVILFNVVSAAATGNTISIKLSKSPAINSTDNYLIPLDIGNPPQTIYLNPSTSTDDTFAISPRACTPTGNTTALKGCVGYRGGVFGPKQPSSYTAAKSGFTWKDDQYLLFADGNQGQDTVTLVGDDVALKEFTFGLVDACNMTSGFMGLGQNSTLLARLVEDGKIGTPAYGLHVGIDIENHAYPILDPTFDDPGEKPANFNSGVGKFKRATSASNATVGEVHSFPGYLTLGGYDKSRIDNGVASLNAPITDGKLELELTNMVLVNQLLVNGGQSHDVFNRTRKVVIDSSTPYMHLPETTAQQLSSALGATYGDPLEDFYFGSSTDRYIGNITFSLQVPGGGDSIDIVIPPSVLYERVTALRDYIPVGNDLYDRYLPIKTFKDSSEQPVILGRTFLKAAYLFVDYENRVFQVSQVAYTDNKPNIVAAVALSTGKSSGTHDSTEGNSTNSLPPDEKRPPILLIVAVSGAAGVFFASGACLLLWRRRKTPPQNALQPIPSSVTVNNYYGNELDGNDATRIPMTSIPQQDEKNQLGPGHPGNQDWGVWEQQKDGSGYYTPHPLAAGGVEYHEMESDYVGMATSPSQAYPPQWVELPATPPPVRPAYPQYELANQPNPSPYGQPYQSGPKMLYEMV